MGKTSLNDIQKSIYTKLTGDTTLMAMITGVFDYVPKNQTFPYVNIGDATENIFNTFDRQGRDVTYSIYVYSVLEGYKEALTILSRISYLLDYTTITLTENDLVYIRYDNGETSFLEVDNGRTRMVAGRFRIIVQEK